MRWSLLSPLVKASKALWRICQLRASNKYLEWISLSVLIMCHLLWVIQVCMSKYKRDYCRTISNPMSHWQRNYQNHLRSILFQTNQLSRLIENSIIRTWKINKRIQEGTLNLQIEETKSKWATLVRQIQARQILVNLLAILMNLSWILQGVRN